MSQLNKSTNILLYNEKSFSPIRNTVGYLAIEKSYYFSLEKLIISYSVMI